MASKELPSPHSSATVQVVVRLRPLNTREKKHGTLPVVSASTADKSVTVIKGQGSRQVRSSYTFDNVFTAFSSQEEVFDATLKPIIRDVMQGFESTVFAYGQTGTGKTHTMEGDIDNAEMQGVIPRSAKAIFEELNSPGYQEHSVSCSFLEIYNEDLCDLLVDPDTTPPKLDIMVGKDGPFCRGLSEQNVTSAEHVLSLMRLAQNQRQVGETNMNKQSSRSHCIFTMKIEAKRKLEDGGILKVGGKLHCVDLAGSECAKSANLEKGNDSQASRERERKNINRSLLTLGRVVAMLKEQSQSRKKTNIRIPYRDSKLTRILQESLGGRCKTCLIATISPSVTAIEESMSTLNYAQAANGIVNKPITTSFLSASSSSAMDHHKSSSGGGKNEAGAVEHWGEMECRLEYMKAQVEEAQQALARKHLQQQELVEKGERAHEARQQAEAQYNEAKQENNALREEIQEHVAEKETLSQELAKTQKTLKETNAILRATQHTESCLAKEADRLIQALKKSIQDGNAIHFQLLQKRDEDIERKSATSTFNESVVVVFEDISKVLDGLSSVQKDFGESISDSTRMTCNRLNQLLNKHQQSIEGLSKHVQDTSSTLKAHMEDENGVMPTVQATTASIRVKTKKGAEILRHGEKKFASSFRGIRDHLEASAQHLKELDAGCHEASTKMQQNLSEKLLHTEHMLQALVAAASTTLAKRKEERTRSSEALQNLVEEWQTSSRDSTSSVMAQADSQSSQVLETLQMLAAEMSRHDETDQHLAKQRAFLKETDIQHTAVLQKQSQLLSSQKQTFDVSQQRNKEFCDQFMSNVMCGVQDLIQNQMEVITNQSKSDYDSFVSGNEEMARVHTGVHTSSQNIFSTIASTNQHLLTNFQVIRENESKASKVLQQTNTAFDDIRDSSANHQSLVEQNAQAVGDMLRDSQATDFKALEQLDQDLQRDGQACGKFVTDDIHNEMRQGFNQLLESTAATSSFVKTDVIRSTKDFVTNSMEKPLGNLVNTMKETMEEIAVEVQDGNEKIRTLATEHCGLVASMDVHVDSFVKEGGEFISEQRSVVSEHESTFQNAIEDHEGTVLDNVATMKGLSSKCESTVSDFSHEVIRPHEHPAEIAEKENPVYSEHLSKTPASKVILRDLYTDVTEESIGESHIMDDAEDVSNAAEDKENNVENVMEECENDEEQQTIAVLQEQKRNRSDSIDAGKKRSLEPPKTRATEKRSGLRLKKPRTRV